MNENGWIKLHRKTLSSEVFKNEKLLKVFIYLLLKVESKEKEIEVKNKTVRLSAGQFYFDKETACKELGMSSSTIYYYLKKLEDLEIIHIRSNNKYTVIKVRNWSKYQSQYKRNYKDKKYTKPKETGKVFRIKID